ncbi:restriction endonuclease [Kitasatospora sp. NPDC057692]|uniref:restriction endonuclease n=1 Tax=Kitasatospora sp. NPDC057692 TaxID=3346215 RepID=UPI00368B142F
MSRLATLDDNDVLNRYVAETGMIARHSEFLPLVLAFLHRATEGGSGVRPSRQYRERIRAASASIELLLQIIDDTKSHLDLVRKDATPVMSACAGRFMGREVDPLEDCRGRLAFWLAEEEGKLVHLRTRLAEVELAYWDARHGQCRDATDPRMPLRNAPLVEHPETLHRIDAEITRSSARIVYEMKKQPAVLFEPRNTVPIAVVDELTAPAFERLVAALMERDGFDIRRRGGFGGDAAADVIARWPIEQLFAVQVKHTRRGRKVEPSVVREVASAAYGIHEADFAVIVTNGDFTQGALSDAERLKVSLVNRIDLVRWVELGEPLIGILTGVRS